ncbi:MFS transporter [Achromobacter sp. GG226]|uniref:MFS transporter n=1 Tax=Verticiella alkaliphila TaxID=2779529 RepID=UPI001C0D3B30|nr:MFS transporter [Verticiella sp. GG226]MBU4610649.1 MFS transporter [Verticiella sp. GG226]
MTRASNRESAPSGRLATLELIGACLIVLVLAQALIGLLSLAAYSRLATSATAERVELLTRNAAASIEAGLRLGKPLAQFSGLQRVLERSLGDQPDVLHAQVVLPDGFTLAALGQTAPPDTDLEAVAAAPALTPPPGTGLRRLGGDAVLYDGQALIAVAVPLQAGPGPAEGVLSVWVDDGGQAEREAAFLKRSLGVLAMTTGAAVLVLALVFGVLGVAAPAAGVLTGWRLALPLAAMLIAQGVYALDATTSFRAAWLEATRGNVMMLAERTQRDLERVMEMGVDMARVRGIDTMFSRLSREMPAVQSLRLIDRDGRTLAAADGAGTLPRAGESETAAAASSGADDMMILLPLSRAVDGAREPAGTLDIRLDPAVIAAGVRSRVLDAGTVALISAITAFELFLLLAVVMTRARGTDAPVTGLVPGGPVARAERVARIARPVMFGFLFAWALPLSFIPLYAGTLPASFLSLPRDLLMALPLSAEMLCGLVGALLAGRLTDRRGWRLPVLCGLLLAAGAALVASIAHTLETFVLARAFVGLGYGLAWMGLQGFVVTRSSPVFRGRNMAWLLAGLFAGHLSGTAVGAMLADQAGYRPVFIASAALLVLPMVGVLWLASRQRRLGRMPAAAEAVASPVRAPLPEAGRAPVRPGSRRRELVRLIFSRDFGALLAGSVVPFSVAQVGLLYFALPLYLQAQGVGASSIGRVLMLYGLCMIYLGPFIGRVVDRTARKKPLIVLGGLLGSAGMVYLYVDNSLFAVSLAVFLLALGSCWSGAAQTVWMLSLPNVQRYGPGSATSVMRAADKFGQMVGPLFVGFLFTVVGTAHGLAITGVFYLLATLVFVAVAPGKPQRVEA